MTKYTDFEETDEEYTHVLLMGEPGTGKTTLIASLLTKFNIIYICLDNGHKVFKRLPKEQKERIDIIQLPDTRDRPIAADTARKLIVGPWPFTICNAHGQKDCSVCKGSGAGFSSYDFRNLNRNTVVVLDNATQLSYSFQSSITKGKPVDYKFQQDDWGALLFYNNELGSAIQNSKYNIVVITHISEEKYTDGTKKISPMMGSVTTASKFAGHFDEVIYCHQSGNKDIKFGNKIGYRAGVLTRSRSEIYIEDMPVPSLVPYFELSSEQIISKRKTDDALEAAIGTEKIIAGQYTIVEDKLLDGSTVEEKVAQLSAPAPKPQLTLSATNIIKPINQPAQQLVSPLKLPPTLSSSADGKSPAELAREKLALLRGVK